MKKPSLYFYFIQTDSFQMPFKTYTGIIKEEVTTAKELIEKRDME